MADLSQLNSFESIIRQLEHISPGPGKLPGTRLNRLVIDQALAEAYKLGHPPGATDWPDGPMRAWCLTLGRVGHPHDHIFYGWGVSDVVAQAVKELLLGKARA